MLERFRKRLEDLLAPGARDDVYEEDDAAVEFSPPAFVPPTPPTTSTGSLKLPGVARREARRRESRLVLAERLRNKSVHLMSELRNRLLQRIHARLDEASGSQTLRGMLAIALDPAFVAELDRSTYSQVDSLIGRLRKEFGADSDIDALLPQASDLVGELQVYRDQILSSHLLEQIEVYALPPIEQTFPQARVTPDELRQRISSYWAACRVAGDRFFHSVEMSLLSGAREGIRLDGKLIRERLHAARYRNGYRHLGMRFADIYAAAAQLQLSSSFRLQQERALIDRRVVDEIVVPLAFFIRDRQEPEPLEALASRAEVFGEIIDKLVAVSDPYVQTAEALKPLLRRSIEQARPLALERFPYLRAAIESFRPSEIHRATALLHLLETLVLPDLDELALEAVEQNVRLNKAQYQLYRELSRTHRSLVPRLAPFDRIEATDAEFLMRYLEDLEPQTEAVGDWLQKLGYLVVSLLPVQDVERLLRAIAVMMLPRHEMVSCRGLYGPSPPAPDELDRFAKSVIRHIRPTGIGADDRQGDHSAVPAPVDLARAVEASGYLTRGSDPQAAFVQEVHDLIKSGEAASLARALELLRRLASAVDAERVAGEQVFRTCDPYQFEVWLQEQGALVGFVFFQEAGYGTAPVEKVVRSLAQGSDVEEKLKRQLHHQAVIYRAFYDLFHRDLKLPLARRQSLPAYLKTAYERIDANRNSFSIHLKNAGLLLKRLEEFMELIEVADPSAASAASAVRQILTGLLRKVEKIHKEVEGTGEAEVGARLVRELERVLKYLNAAVLHSVNPWLARETRGLATQFEYREEDIVTAIRRAASSSGLDWEKEVERVEVNPIKGTVASRALVVLVDGSSKVVLLEFDRRRREWVVKHFAPRLSDVIRSALRQFDKLLPDDYDEKFEQPILGLNETTSRFFLVKRGVVRLEATLILDPSESGQAWRVVFLKWNDDVLVDRHNPLVEVTGFVGRTT